MELLTGIEPIFPDYETGVIYHYTIGAWCHQVGSNHRPFPYQGNATTAVLWWLGAPSWNRTTSMSVCKTDAVPSGAQGLLVQGAGIEPASSVLQTGAMTTLAHLA